MTIETLRKYTHLIGEINLIKAEIADAYMPVSSPNGHEVLGAPGTRSSDPTAKAAELASELHETLTTNYIEAIDLRMQIEKWITTIDDPEISRIVRQHFIIGPQKTGPRHRVWTWADTCESIYGFRDNRHARRKVTNYLKQEERSKQNESQQTE